MRLLLLLLALLPLAARALAVGVTPVHRLQSPVSPHESLEQRWTIAPSAADDEIQELRIDSLCQVLVSYAAQDADDAPQPLAATVRVTGSDFKLITTADVAVVASQTLQIRLQDSHQLDRIDGRVGVHVTLHQPTRLQRLRASGDGDVVVAEKVFVDAEIRDEIVIESSGAGSVYLPDSLSLTASSVSISTADSGSVYLPTATTVTAPSVAFYQSGGGDIVATSARLDAASNVSVTASGSGDICVDATFLETGVIVVHATGSGDVYLGGHDGTYESSHRFFCNAARVYGSGAGSVDLGTIECIDVDVELYGAGDVIVESARSLSGHAFGAGKIFFSGQSPEDVLPVDPWAFIKQPIAHAAAQYKPRSCEVPATPTRRLTHFGEGLSVMHHIFSPTHVGIVVLLMACFGAVYAFENRRQRRERQRELTERTPLLARSDASR